MITVSAELPLPLSTVWEKWTHPEHVTQWNFAHESWHCPKASSDFQVGGEFHYLMAARDGSFEFDFWGTFDAIEMEKQIAITLGDGRKMVVDFVPTENGTRVTETFEPEQVNPVEMQKQGWQAILERFKVYAMATV